MSKSKQILIVDDNPINLQLVEDLMIIEGYDVRVAKTGSEALKTLTTFLPRLILMDIQLPEMNGLELTQKLKANPKYKDIVIIAVTALAMKQDKENALAAGCDKYLSKPVDIDELSSTVASYF